jgi:hypothetical protein
MNPVSQFTAQLHAATIKVPQTVHVRHAEAEELEQAEVSISQVVRLEKLPFDCVVLVQKGRQKHTIQIQVKEVELFSVLCST